MDCFERTSHYDSMIYEGFGEAKCSHLISPESLTHLVMVKGLERALGPLGSLPTRTAGGCNY